MANTATGALTGHGVLGIKPYRRVTLTSQGALAATAQGRKATGVLLGHGVPAGTTIPMIATLKDNFSASNATLWTYGGGNSVSGDALNLALVNGSNCYTNIRYDAVGSSVYAHINPSTAGTASSGAAFYMVISPDATPDIGTNSFGFDIYQGGIDMLQYISGTLTSAAGPAYNATTHAWMRLRATGGTGYLDAAPDGINWTNIVSLSYSTLNLTNVGLVFQAYQSSGSTYALVQNLNVGPFAYPTPMKLLSNIPLMRAGVF